MKVVLGYLSPPNGHALVNTIGRVGDDVVQLVGHTARLGDVSDRALAVQLGGDDVVHHATSVTNLEGSRLDASHGGRADDGDALLLRDVENLACALRGVVSHGFGIRGSFSTYSLGHALSDDGDGLDLGELHELHGGAVDAAGRGEVDDGVDIAVLGHGLLDGLVDGQQGLAGAPVHLADELAAEGVDDAGDGGGLALADEVEVEHTLDGAGLQAVDEASGLVVEEGVRGVRAQGAAGRGESTDVVVRREAAAGGGSGRAVGGGRRHDCEGGGEERGCAWWRRLSVGSEIV